MTVEESVEAHIADIRRRDAKLADDPLTAVALALAREIDAGNSATSKSMCAAQLQTVLGTLRELAPPEKARDRLDELSDRRSKRRGRSATA